MATFCSFARELFPEKKRKELDVPSIKRNRRTTECTTATDVIEFRKRRREWRGAAIKYDDDGRQSFRSSTFSVYIDFF